MKIPYICITNNEDLTNFQFNINNATIDSGDFLKSSEFTDTLCENEGSFKVKDQFIEFLCDGFNIVVNYDLTVCGQYESFDDDYWTPGYVECSIDDIDVKITDVFIDEYEVELNSQLIQIFTKLIKSKI